MVSDKNYSGKVVKRTFGESSKSHHEGVFLVTENEDEYKLRRAGGNPFKDAVLEGLVGMTIALEGTEMGATLVMESWEELNQPKTKTQKKSSKKKSSKNRSTSKKSKKARIQAKAKQSDKKPASKVSSSNKSTKKKSSKLKSRRSKSQN